MVCSGWNDKQKEGKKKGVPGDLAQKRKKCKKSFVLDFASSVHFYAHLRPIHMIQAIDVYHKSLYLAIGFASTVCAVPNMCENRRCRFPL
jgi:hypothetical protein